MLFCAYKSCDSVVIMIYKVACSSSLFIQMEEEIPMKVGVCLYPSYVNLVSLRGLSHKMCEFLDEQGVELEEGHWSGRIESIPTDHAVMVRGSTIMPCDFGVLARRCVTHGHLVFCGNSLVLPNGMRSEEKLIPAIQVFLDRIMQQA
jgi:hypothetical protein